MEYERALFRVYERCLEGFIPNTQENTTKSCEVIEHLVLVITFVFIGILTYLHLIFVGSAGCLPEKLQDYALIHNSSVFNFTNDQIIQIFIDTQDSILFDQSDYLGRKLDPLISQNITNQTLVNTTLPDYEFAGSWAVLRLSSEIRKDHNFELVNITYTPECFGTSLQQNFLPFGGIDMVIVNNIMTTIPSGGVLSSRSGEIYSWNKPSKILPQSFMDWISFKLSMLTKGLFSYFILSTTTALLVRILISSGVVLLLPFFWALQLCGLHVLNSRIFTLSYPWLGVPMEILRIRNQSTGPFLISHITRVLIYYLMYEATQLALSYWLYHEDPGPKELWLYVIMMILEYYSMIYLRSSLSIKFFPTATLLFYLLYHIYLFSFPAGFHLLALLCLFLAVSHLMIFTLRKFEIPVFLRGIVTIDSPRETYNALPWPSWEVSLAPDYTIFLPLTHRARSIYDTLPGNNDEENLQIPIIPPNYNTLATFPRRRRPPTPIDDLDQSEHARFLSPLLHSDDSQHDHNWDEKTDLEEERKDDESTTLHRFGLNTIVNRLQQVLDESDSDENTQMIRSSEGNPLQSRPDRSERQRPPDRDIEMGVPSPNHHM